MKIVFFAHPAFLGHQSMPRFAQMLADGMQERGHEVVIWAPKAYFSKFALLKSFKKWLGYIDQYVVFPQIVRRRLSIYSTDTLFVFTDQALGPWVPLLSTQPRIVHCHDFLAQRSVLGEIPENTSGWSGRQYQRFIRNGYIKGQNFISVSKRTQQDLHRFLPSIPLQSHVVYNGLNQNFAPHDILLSRRVLENETGISLYDGYILHVGGNHFYKNRPGVIEIYTAWRSSSKSLLPLLLIGELPDKTLLAAHEKSPFKSAIHMLNGVSDALVQSAYAGATVFVFPSLAEGFGWPIAEAMASGCPVITTNEAPMTEVAGDAAFLIPRRPIEQTKVASWAGKAASILEKVVMLTATQRQAVIQRGLLNAARFDTNQTLDRIEAIYQRTIYENMVA